MTVEYVREAVAFIRQVSGDDERAHALEDSLYLEVLTEIASGINDDSAKELAEAAIKASDLDFARWCA